jgi:hypothetical protein
MFKTSIRGVVAAATLALASVAAHADTLSFTLDFDSLSSGATANAYLASLGLGSQVSFGNGDYVQDDPIYDSIGNVTNDGAGHWVDASSVYGDVLVKDNGTAISGSNVLWNDNQAILVQFNSALTINAFSIQQDSSLFGNLTENGSILSFLDSTGHVISTANVYYTQYGQPGLTISSGTVTGVSAILLSAGKSYDNLSLNAVTAVPEPTSLSMVLVSLGLVGAAARRRRAR